MTDDSHGQITRRELLQQSAMVGGGTLAGMVGTSYWLGGRSRISRAAGKKVIVIGIDGMDPVLSGSMMREGLLPNLTKLTASGGFSPLGTSIPPQSPVAWANFINGAGPGSHGIFDFIHRHPQHQCEMFYSAAETIPGRGGWDVGEHRLQLDFWPFNHQPPATLLQRKGTPFWEYLDAAGIPSTFYDLPSNYPPSPSTYGHHRCICGMGTPDMLGGYGTYQYFGENCLPGTVEEGGGRRTKLVFQGETTTARLKGPDNVFLRQAQAVEVELHLFRDRKANSAVIEVQGTRIVLNAGQWSHWTKIDFQLSTPAFLPDHHAAGICRFYLQEVTPNFRLYVSPINIDPSAAAVVMSEPSSFIGDLSDKLGLFGTAGFQEDHKARTNGIFVDDEFAQQAAHVLEERLALFDYAVDDYDDGLLFFYFSSGDLQSHMFWWDSDERHPSRSANEARKWHEHVRRLYRRLDAVVGDIMDRYGNQATIMVMSDHGFANFGRQFNLNSWLRYAGYLWPPECTGIDKDIDWSRTAAYGLGINGLYLNLKGRERDGIIEPGQQQEELLTQLATRLEAITDANGQQIIRRVYRSDQVYTGGETALAPDLIVGYARGYRASWDTCLGGITDDILFDNDQSWSADHCADALEVPGVFFCNRPMKADTPSLIDVAPSILAEYRLPTPATMIGRSVFG